MKVRRWATPEEPLPARPYRDTLLFHLALAAIIVLVAWATGGGIGRALAFAIAFFVVATAWSWSRWRKRIDEERRKQEGRRGAAARAGRRP